MKALFCFCLCLASLHIHAETSPPAAPGATACSDCGVIRSIQSKVKEQRPPDIPGSKPSGLVATVPMGGGKTQVGSSTKLGKEAVVSATTWDVVVRLDDGRIRIVTLDRAPDFHEGDRVRIEGNRLLAPPAPAANAKRK